MGGNQSPISLARRIIGNTAILLGALIAGRTIWLGVNYWANMGPEARTRTMIAIPFGLGLCLIGAAIRFWRRS